MSTIMEGLDRFPFDGEIYQQQRAGLNALDIILQQEARDTSSVRVYGNKIFDLSDKPAMEVPFIELRRGLNTRTFVVNMSVVRRITPCTGFFLKSMRVSELLRLLRSAAAGTGPSLDMEQVNRVLTGVKIRKAYGKQDVVQIAGIAVGNPEQETFYWNNHKTTTISHYMEKVHHVEDVNMNPQQKCLVVKSVKHTEILPCNLCSVLPGQCYPQPVSSDYFEQGKEQVYRSLLRDIRSSCISRTDGVFRKVLKGSVSPTVAAQFGLNISGIGESNLSKQLIVLENVVAWSWAKFLRDRSR